MQYNEMGYAWVTEDAKIYDERDDFKFEIVNFHF